MWDKYGWKNMHGVQSELSGVNANSLTCMHDKIGCNWAILTILISNLAGNRIFSMMHETLKLIHFIGNWNEIEWTYSTVSR